jgi:hypothetical protein
VSIADLAGKTIASATRMKKAEYDDEAWLQLHFTDGSSCVIVASYGGYSGESEDEYPSYFYIKDSIEGLMPA